MNTVIIRPEGSLQILSQQEAQQLCDRSDQGLNELLRQCALAVLNTGNNEDDGLKLIERHPDFDIQVVSKGRGVQLHLTNPPQIAFVDGELMAGIKEHLFAVVRDLIYTRNDILASGRFDLADTYGITNAIFHQLRNANILKPNTTPDIVVCWGGHAIARHEYEYSKYVGYECGLRELNVCTGCGPGAMKGPMKGAAVGHSKQRHTSPRYIGLTEPGIIAAEAPNAIVNELVILPDIEKRLEAFVRVGHAIVVLPGGAGTMEELLYLLSILLHPDNAQLIFPLVLTGPKESAPYFNAVREFVITTLGETAWQKVTLLIDQPEKTAAHLKTQLQAVREQRKASSDAYYFNWQLKIPSELQHPFIPTHINMAALNLHPNQPSYQLASQLRCAFSGIVAGNVKAQGIRAISEFGPYLLRGDHTIMRAMDKLLATLVEQKRMKLGERPYNPCYRITNN
ncbi:MAG: LOG family protein [Thiotrichales bacterium]|jgi:hypothetical protein|nr:LOG family protein [Thiotrichales bacterium]